MDTITRDQAPHREPAYTDAAASLPRPIGGRSHALQTQPANRKLYGCARNGCLEIAKPGTHHCPLHE
jgi:hypothetical protein